MEVKLAKFEPMPKAPCNLCPHCSRFLRQSFIVLLWYQAEHAYILLGSMPSFAEGEGPLILGNPDP